MDRILFIMTHSFPYGEGETFLDDEMEYTSIFDRVIITPMISGDVRRYNNLSGNIKVIETGEKLYKLDKVVWIIRAMFSINIWYEIFYLIKNKLFSFSKIRSLIVTTAYGERMAQKSYLEFCKNYDKKKNQVEVVLYAYWLTSCAYSIIRLKKKINIKKIFTFSRCHGHDLYEYRRSNSYLPYRKLFFEKLDEIRPISENGKKYLTIKYDFEMFNKIKTTYLGTKDYGLNLLTNNEAFTIVSCSSLIPLKRVHLIIDTLTKFKDENIKWIHIGGGILSNDIAKIANEKLMGKVDYELVGDLTHAQVISFYSNTQINLFVNTSESEGIPVSIMEALSFGIPVIATDVGGVSEIISNGYNGFLIDKNFTLESFEQKIRMLMDMPIKEYLKLRENARNQWLDKFNAENNHSELYCELIEKFL